MHLLIEFAIFSMTYKSVKIIIIIFKIQINKSQRIACLFLKLTPSPQCRAGIKKIRNNFYRDFPVVKEGKIKKYVAIPLFVRTECTKPARGGGRGGGGANIVFEFQ